MRAQLDFGTAFYHCVVTATTVGYGDVALTTQAARAWASFHILVSVSWRTLSGEIEPSPAGARAPTILTSLIPPGVVDPLSIRTLAPARADNMPSPHLALVSPIRLLSCSFPAPMRLLSGSCPALIRLPIGGHTPHNSAHTQSRLSSARWTPSVLSARRSCRAPLC